jgi:hypothetical protein
VRNRYTFTLESESLVTMTLDADSSEEVNDREDFTTYDIGVPDNTDVPENSMIEFGLYS